MGFTSVNSSGFEFVGIYSKILTALGTIWHSSDSLGRLTGRRCTVDHVCTCMGPSIVTFVGLRRH